MSEGQAASTRAVSLTREDLSDLRSKLSSDGFEARERELVQYLTEQAETDLDKRGETDSLWTWTYRF
jgi:hypothetical protein